MQLDTLKNSLSTVVLSFVLSFSSVAQGATSAEMGEMFNRLQESALDAQYEIIGTVCEQVAKLRFEDLYSADDYFVTVGIAYSNHSRTIGELDIVVFEKDRMEAIIVGEVKCWKNMRGGLNKALEQRRRFQRTIEGQNEQIFLRSTSVQDEEYTPDQFDEEIEYLAIAQDGSEAAGFDMSLGFSLGELMDLRDMMMACQKHGQCEYSH